MPSFSLIKEGPLLDITHRIVLCMTSAAALFTGGFLLHYGMEGVAVALAGLGTFALGILAATHE
jgi:hypothetical protein